MTATTTLNLAIPLLSTAQAQKEVTINEALNRIDLLLAAGVISNSLSAPPASPATGDAYIVAASPSGAWAGQANALAYFDQVWRFIPPRQGMVLWVASTASLMVHNSGSWGPASADLTAPVYDPANIAEQLVGLNAAQTLANKTLTSPTINGPTVLTASSGNALRITNTGSGIGWPEQLVTTGWRCGGHPDQQSVQ